MCMSIDNLKTFQCAIINKCVDYYAVKNKYFRSKSHSYYKHKMTSVSKIFRNSRNTIKSAKCTSKIVMLLKNRKCKNNYQM